MVTKKDGAASATPAMTSELLKKMAEEQQNKEKGGGDKKGEGDKPGSNNGENAPDATDGEPANKKAKTSGEEKGGGGGKIRIRSVDPSHV